MTWAHDSYLYLLLAIPLLGLLPLWSMRVRARATERFGKPQTVRGLIVGNASRWRALRAVLLLVGLTLVVIALAGPRYGSRTRILHHQGLDIVIALDFSKSMLARDVRPNRIDRTKAELSRLLEELNGDRIGIVAFAGETMEFPMTTDHAALTLFLRDLGPYDMPVGGTAIARALISAKRLLERSEQVGGGDSNAESTRDRVVILMTDGEDHEGEPTTAARELAEAGIRVFTVGIGSQTGEPIPTYAPDGTWTGYLRDENGEVVTTSLSEENEAVLREVAEVTDGAYFRAQRGQVGVDEIREQLQLLERDALQARRVTVHEPRYVLVLFPAFLLLLLEALLPEAWLGRRKRRPRPQPSRKRGG